MSLHDKAVRLEVSALARTLYAVRVGHLNIQVLLNQLVPVLAADQRPRPCIVFCNALVLIVDSPGNVAVSNSRRWHLYYAETVVVVTLPSRHDDLLRLHQAGPEL